MKKQGNHKPYLTAALVEKVKSVFAQVGDEVPIAAVHKAFQAGYRSRHYSHHAGPDLDEILSQLSEVERNKLSDITQLGSQLTAEERKAISGALSFYKNSEEIKTVGDLRREPITRLVYYNRRLGLLRALFIQQIFGEVSPGTKS